MNLRRFWFRFDLPPIGDKQPHSWLNLRLGCGVTGYNEADCRTIIEVEILGSDPWPPVIEITPDIDVSKLDAGHVLPNLEPPNWRGIWFPRGLTKIISSETT